MVPLPDVRLRQTITPSKRTPRLVSLSVPRWKLWTLILAC